MSVTLRLEGDVPSKKNKWKRGMHGNVYLPVGAQAEIDALIWQAIGARNKNLGPLTDMKGYTLRVEAHFTVPRAHKDLDNIFTTLLDVLQKAGVIENDKLVRAFSVSETVTLEKPCVEVTINRLSTIERPTHARGKGKIRL